MGTWAMDINIDTGCSRLMDSDMALSSSPGLDDTMVLVTSRPSNTNMVTGDSLDLVHLCGLQ